MINLGITEDNTNLRKALIKGLEATGEINVVFDCDNGEDAIEQSIKIIPDVILMDVQINGSLNGIQTAISIRKELPRLPVVFYSIQDNDSYYIDFCRSGILSHYAYVKKSNYLLPEMIIPLLKNACSGLGFIDPDIEERVQEVMKKDELSPMSLLEPNEQMVITMIAAGLTNEQIATKVGFRDKRTISRINGQIYTAWGLNETTDDEKIARTRAIIIFKEKKLIEWDKDGNSWLRDKSGQKVKWEGL